MDGTRATKLYEDFLCMLSQYELNKEIFIEPIEAYKAAVIVCKESGILINQEHKDPEFRLLQNGLICGPDHDLSLVSYFISVESFIVTAAVGHNETKLFLKLYIDRNYGTDIDSSIDFKIECPSFENSRLVDINEQFKGIVLECSVKSISDYVSNLPALQQILEDSIKLSPFEDKVMPKLNVSKARYWIVSHHIYSKEKRKDMIFWAKEYQLNGFCLPGKPGVICVEGDSEFAEEFWARIRKWNWQRLQLVMTETFTCSCFKRSKSDNSNDIICKCLLFNVFEELVFENAPSHTKQDMSKFKEFLCEHNCANVFDTIFGFGSDWNKI